MTVTENQTGQTDNQTAVTENHETHMGIAAKATEKARAEADAYRAGHDRPLGAFIGTMTAYGAMVAGMATFVTVKHRELPGRLGWSDLALVALATHKASRLVSKDSVTSALRAPFTRFKGSSGPAELAEDVRGEGVRKAVGELVSCPFCLDQWVATLAVFGLVIAPKPTRLAADVFAVVAGADMLQFAYAKLQQAE